MINITVTFEDIDYESVIDALVPFAINGKVKQSVARITANTLLKGLTNEEKDTKTIEFINEHPEKICAFINKRLAELGANTSVTQIYANNSISRKIK